MESTDEREEQTKTWSLEEANEIIPIIAKAFDGIFAVDEQIESINKDISVLYDIWGVDLIAPSNPDSNHYRELRFRKATLQKCIEHAVIELKRMGCVIDDLKRGIVHFYHKTQNGVIVFCWRYGEQHVTHWHELSWRADRKKIGLKEV